MKRRHEPLLALVMVVLLSGCPMVLRDDFTVAASDAAAPSDAGPGRDATCGDGGCACDANTDGDPSNCGTCGHACAPGHACSAGVCAAWAPVAPPPATVLSAREKAAACALADGRVFVWGGADATGAVQASGAIYDPARDAWDALPTSPLSPRAFATAVCLSTKVVVLAGADLAGAVDYRDGATYDLADKVWTPTPNPPAALSARRAPYGVSQGTAHALFWGGELKTGRPAGGNACLFDTRASSWQPSNGGGPPTLLAPTVASTVSSLLVFGGQAGANDTSDLFLLDNAADWTNAPPAGAPSARRGAFGAHDGVRLLVWGGLSGATTLESGGSFLPPAGPWKSTASAMAPTARAVAPQRTGWTFSLGGGRSLLVGGVLNGDVAARDGAIYDSSADTWTALPSWTTNEDHEWGVAVWTGRELFVWGGRTGSSVSATGTRFAPP